MKLETKHLILREMMPEDSAGDRLPHCEGQPAPELREGGNPGQRHDTAKHLH